MEAIGQYFVSDISEGRTMETSLREISKDKKVFGLYFAANWCLPCRIFTPILTDFYESVNQERKQFEIIFVSVDKNIKEWEETFFTMPWISIPFGDKRCKKLIKQFDVQGIPNLIIIDVNGNIIVNDRDARIAIQESDHLKTFQSWFEKSLQYESNSSYFK